jgi:hypothetical protein
MQIIQGGKLRYRRVSANNSSKDFGVFFSIKFRGRFGEWAGLIIFGHGPEKTAIEAGIAGERRLCGTFFCTVCDLAEEVAPALLPAGRISRLGDHPV